MNKFTFAQRPEGFDTHIENSIRGYSNLIDDVISISDYFIEDNTKMIDIGCSTGLMLKTIINNRNYVKSNVEFIGIEMEKDFYGNYTQDELTHKNLKYFRDDVNKYDFKNHEASYITSIFSLQFISLQYRQNIINNIFNSLIHGGAFIFSEKVISKSSKIHEIRTFTHYDYKRKFFDSTDILLKEHELRRMMKPTTNEELIQMCINSGFKLNNIDTFWQNHSFKGYIAIKE